MARLLVGMFAFNLLFSFDAVRVKRSADLEADFTESANVGVIMQMYRTLDSSHCSQAARFFASDGLYAHTGEKSVTCPMALKSFLHAMCRKGAFDGSAEFQIQTTVTNNLAFAVTVSRPGKRDSLFMARGKIKAMFTTNAHPKDEFPNATESLSLPFPRQYAPEVENVKAAIDVYFNSFVARSAEGMLSAFAPGRVDYMFDFSPDRKAPFACMMSDDCGTAPAMFDGASLLNAFSGFTSGYINLNHKFDTVEIYGNMALVTTVSLGCEGDFVTPKGEPPMPNRELFVAVKQSGEWKIKSYMFTHDPASPLNPPVDTCPPEFPVGLSDDVHVGSHAASAVGLTVAAQPTRQIAKLYRILASGACSKAARFFARNGVYAHTGEKSVTGRMALASFLQTMCSKGAFNGSGQFQIQTKVTNKLAFVATVTRPGKRDSLFMARGKIKAMFTTNASPNDEFPNATETLSLPVPRRGAPEVENVKAAVDIYFNSFVAKKPEGMLSAFASGRVDYMFDFSPDRKAPFACMMSEDCGTAPAMFDGASLSNAFSGFTSGYINLNHKFDTVEIYGNMAMVTTVSLGCEGDFVTPSGALPMPNRELFVVVKQAGEWKIKSYMFTYDPASPLTPPVDHCLAR